MGDDRQYDVVIVGAGPAGLSAARTVARLGFSTLVLERLERPGQMRHPCNGVITPVPGFVSARRLLDGLFLPSLDLLIPASLILGYPPVQRLISPAGYEYATSFSRTDDFPAAVVDKPGLMELMARQARSAGAEMRFGVAATGLLHDGERIAGVVADGEPITAPIVISAEGSSRRLCIEAGVSSREPARQYVVLVSQDMEVPGLGADDVGQILTAGRRYTSAPQAFGMLVVPSPGRATVFLTLYLDAAQALPDSFLWFYLDEYVQTDVRVRDLLAGARVLGRSRHKIALQSAPEHVVRDGFIGAGDAITPAGHLGILPSIYLGRQAALVASEALDRGDISAEALAPYDELLHESILPNLDAEAKIMLGLTKMDDQEIDRLCQALSGLHLATPIFSNWRTLAWEMVGSLVRQFPGMVHDWRLLQEATSRATPEI